MLMEFFMLDEYKKNLKERNQLDIDAKPLNAEQVSALIDLLISPPRGEEKLIKCLFVERVPPGVDDAAMVKANFLSDLASGKEKSPLIDKQEAVGLLGTMLGGYNIESMIDFLDVPELGKEAAKSLSNTILVFDYFDNYVDFYSNKSIVVLKSNNKRLD